MADRTIRKLAGLARDLERRRQLCANLETALATIERFGYVAGGERDELNQRQSVLAAAHQALEGLESAGEARQERQHLSEIEQLLSDGAWEAAELIAGELLARGEQARADYEACTAQIKSWQTRVQELYQKGKDSDAAHAPVVKQRARIDVLLGQVAAVERILRDKGLLQGAEALRQLNAQDQEAKDLDQDLQKQKQDAERLARQTELLLLRSPLVRGHYEYTVLLRTPTQPGSHGINIQDSSTLVRQDHKQFRQVVDEVTAQINAGIARGFGAHPGAAAPAAQPVTAAPAAQPAEAPAPQPGAAVPAAQPASAAPAAQPAGAPAPQPGAAAPAAAGGLRRSLPPSAPLSGVPPRKASDLAHDVGDLMFRLFIPEAMQPFLADALCALTISTNDLELPWELMWSGRDFLCLDRPVARMPMGRALPRRETTVNREGEPLSFLLIYADPDGNLEAAGAEVDWIQSGLRQTWGQSIGIDVWKLAEARGDRLNEALHKGEYDVIHFAGHAAFDKQNPDLSGLLLHGHEVFYAQKVRRLLEGRPLVFLNACESGRTANEKEPQLVERYLQRPAEGLASSFIYGGAAGCVGALWPVYDRPAAELAVEFYNHVVEGHMIGQALCLARRHIRDLYPDQLTWASYVLYGDPTFQLR